jgi:hypothetical protein
MLRFTDGVSIDTSGELRPLKLKDGWYVVGEGMCGAMDSREEAVAFIEDLKRKRKEKENG